ncbi:MAG: hypothetical protein IKK83_05475 [Clostridia bacterium]|nr:hypothetical protein [Clostridia bacterium]
MFYTAKGACRLQAHRGVSTDCPENTLAAFRAAVKQGYEVIELDPAITADGQFVILHDKTVNRTARQQDGGRLATPTPIRELTLEEARRLDVGLWFGDRFRGERIPTLAEVLELAYQTGIELKLDNKVQSFSEEEETAFFDEIEAHRGGHLASFTCSDFQYMCRVNERFPKAALHYDGVSDYEGFLTARYIAEDAPLTCWIRYGNALTAWSDNAPADIELCQQARYCGKLGIWLVDDVAEARRAVDLFGAHIIETSGAVKPTKKQ